MFYLTVASDLIRRFVAQAIEISFQDVIHAFSSFCLDCCSLLYLGISKASVGLLQCKMLLTGTKKIDPIWHLFTGSLSFTGTVFKVSCLFLTLIMLKLQPTPLLYSTPSLKAKAYRAIASNMVFESKLTMHFYNLAF